MSTQMVISTLDSEALKQLNEKLAALKDRADQLEVKDAQGCLLAKTLKLDIGSYTKAVIFETGPAIEVAKEKLRNLQAQQKMLLAPAEAMLETSERKRKDWENEERRLAQIEQDRINREARIAQSQKAEEERRENERIAKEQREAREKELEAQRKAGEIGKREQARLARLAAEQEESAKKEAAALAEQTAAAAPVVTVKAAIPTMQGVASRQNWKFRITDEARIPRLYCKPDEVAIGNTVRKLKDKVRTEALIPGIEVWSE